MSYPKEVLLQASAIMSKRKADAELTQKIRHSEIIGKLPNIPQYEAELSKTGLSVL